MGASFPRNARAAEPTTPSGSRAPSTESAASADSAGVAQVRVQLHQSFEEDAAAREQRLRDRIAAQDRLWGPPAPAPPEPEAAPRDDAELLDLLE